MSYSRDDSELSDDEDYYRDVWFNDSELSEDGDERDEELPKCWSAEKGRVCRGVERERKAVSLVSLCGTYLVVCQDGQLEGQELVLTQGSDWRGTFTLESRKSLDIEHPHPDGFKGEMSFGTIRAEFYELEANKKSGKELLNSWNIAEYTEEGDDNFETLDMEVGNVKDDNGNPFVSFLCSEDHLRTTWLAKKQPETGIDEYLSNDEKERLNMGVSRGDLNRRMRGAPVKHPASDDDTSDCEVNEELPKFWSAEEGRVCKGVERERKDVSLVSLCGTYLAVCQDGELEEVFTKHSNWRGTFTLKSRKSLDVKHPHPDGFKGELSFGSIEVEFHELEAIQESGSWSLAQITYKPGSEGFETFYMEVGNVKDDNGNPFVIFFSSNDCQSGSWLAKKQPETGVDEYLTSDEKKRLNMGISGKDLRRRMRGPPAKHPASDDGEDERPSKKMSASK